MPKFIPYNHDQNAMVVINFRDQLQPGTFEHAIHYLIHEKLDLSVFDYAYNNKDGGRPAYNPAILLSVVLFAYEFSWHVLKIKIGLSFGPSYS